ncbi:Glutamyl-tRNA(Gln) amidotransferase subunit C [subsurface metagenome]
MKLTREDVLHIARLARLGLTESELEKFSEQLSNILENFEILQQVDTADIPPTAQSITLPLLGMLFQHGSYPEVISILLGGVG